MSVYCICLGEGKMVHVHTCNRVKWQLRTCHVTDHVTIDITGIENLIKDGIYTAAYPLHDVRSHSNHG